MGATRAARFALAATACAAVLALAGACAGGDAGDGPSTSDRSTGSDGPDSSDADGDAEAETPDPFPANTDPDTQDPSADALLTVTDVRTARHDGYDRVVLELDGTGSPGWRVEYVGSPTSDGKGDVVDVAGDAYLQVMVSGTGYPMDTGVDEYAGPDPVPGPDGGVVAEVTLLGVFEGLTQAFVGVDGEPRPFRAFALEDPARVVVDVRDDD
ncbi:hypothetical protein IF650_16770 [Cellulosimicrobium terreum]|nr:hypothetical protein [Cellulosimicrobium terreum]